MDMEEIFGFIKDEEGIKPIKEKAITITAKLTKKLFGEDVDI